MSSILPLCLLVFGLSWVLIVTHKPYVKEVSFQFSLLTGVKFSAKFYKRKKRT